MKTTFKMDPRLFYSMQVLHIRGMLEELGRRTQPTAVSVASSHDLFPEEQQLVVKLRLSKLVSAYV